MLRAGAGPDIRDSIEDGLLFLNPLSVLLRCSPGRGSIDPEDELVLVRECWPFAFLAASFSRSESRSWVSYGCLASACGFDVETLESNDAVGPELEKLNNMLGSTPPDVEMNELDRELGPSPAVLVANDETTPGEDRSCRAWNACGFI